MSKPSNQSLTNTVNSVKLGNRVAGGKKTLEKTHIWTISVVARKLTLVFLKMTSNEYSRSQKNGRLFCGKLGTRMAVVGRGFRSRREGLAENPVTNHPVASGPPKKKERKRKPSGNVEWKTGHPPGRWPNGCCCGRYDTRSLALGEATRRRPGLLGFNRPNVRRSRRNEPCFRFAFAVFGSHLFQVDKPDDDDMASGGSALFRLVVDGYRVCYWVSERSSVMLTSHCGSPFYCWVFTWFYWAITVFSIFIMVGWASYWVWYWVPERSSVLLMLNRDSTGCCKDFASFDRVFRRFIVFVCLTDTVRLCFLPFLVAHERTFDHPTLHHSSGALERTATHF